MILTDVMPLPRNWLLNVLPKDFHLAYDIHIPCAGKDSPLDKAKQDASKVNYCMEEKNKRKKGGRKKKLKERKKERKNDGKKERKKERKRAKNGGPRCPRY